MFDNIDPVTKQYGIFSIIISLILSFIINFLLIETLKGTFAYGFPINLTGAEGFTLFFYRIVNTLVEALFLIVPIFVAIKWFLNRGMRI